LIPVTPKENVVSVEIQGTEKLNALKKGHDIQGHASLAMRKKHWRKN
jgi:hypothetical protein